MRLASGGWGTEIGWSGRTRRLARPGPRARRTAPPAARRGLCRSRGWLAVSSSASTTPGSEDAAAGRVHHPGGPRGPGQPWQLLTLPACAGPGGPRDSSQSPDDSAAPSPSNPILSENVDAAALRALPQDLAGFLSRGFQDHPIEPLAQPVDTEIDHVAHDELWPDLPLPGVRVAATFIPSDHAERRRLKIRLQMRLRGLLVDLAPKDTPPVPADEQAFLEAVYPPRSTGPAFAPGAAAGAARAGRRRHRRARRPRTLRLVPPPGDAGGGHGR